MNALIEMLAKNVLGGWVTTGVGSVVVWSQLAAVATRFSKGESILAVAMSPEGQALLLGMGSIIGRGPDLKKLLAK